MGIKILKRSIKVAIMLLNSKLKKDLYSNKMREMMKNEINSIFAVFLDTITTAYAQDDER